MAMSDEVVREFANELNKCENYRKIMLVSAINLKNHCIHTDCEECFFFTGDSCPLADLPCRWEIGEVEREEHKEND